MSGPAEVGAVIVTGEGQFDVELTHMGLHKAAFRVQRWHIRDLIRQRISVEELLEMGRLLVFPGGSSYHDDLGAGLITALQIRHRLNWDLHAFAAQGGLVLGIGNGFQALVRMGVFGPDFSVAPNIQGYFEMNWAQVSPQGSRCIWLKGLGTMDLPLRHGCGRIVIAPTRRLETLKKIDQLGTGCLRYEGNPNGSEERLAGLCDVTGRIFGMMPHPESFLGWGVHPEWTLQPARARAPGAGLAIFENAYRELLRRNQ